MSDVLYKGSSAEKTRLKRYYITYPLIRFISTRVKDL